MTEKIKIVVLDGFTLNPGDLSWDGLRSFGDCEIYDRTKPQDTLGRAGGAEIVLTNKTVLDSAAISSLPALRYIGVMATGYNIVDLDAARERGVPVTNIPVYATMSVAQMVFALLLELTMHVAHHSNSVRSGRWTASPDFCYWDFQLTELDGLTVGIVGYGSIGRGVARIAGAFGMRVLACDNRQLPDEPGVAFVDLDTIFRKSDVVSLHCPLTAETEGIINADHLALMKKSAYLINTGRGPLVVESDLADALNSGRIAGAGLDVLQVEPPRADNPLIGAKNCIITPHIAWASQASRSRLMDVVVGNVRSFLQGSFTNVVNGVTND